MHKVSTDDNVSAELSVSKPLQSADKQMSTGMCVIKKNKKNKQIYKIALHPKDDPRETVVNLVTH